MLRLSKKVDYGLMALMHLARHGDSASWSARELAEAYEIPGGLLAKVLQRMAQAGFVASQHGKKGGYTLARPAGQITVAEVVQAIDGPFSLTQCTTEQGLCLQFETCNVKSPLQRLHESVAAMFATLTIAQMVEQETRNEGSGNSGLKRGTVPETKTNELPVLQ
jgi:Rrf2 family protein